MSPGQFLADFQHLAHNIAVVYGGELMISIDGMGPLRLQLLFS